MDALITLRGYVGTEVDVVAGDGWCFSRFRLASTPRYRRYDKWVDGETTWVNVSCSNRLAENVRDCIAKGDPVVVIGRLCTHAWESNGEKQERLVVEATSVGHDLTRGTSLFTKNEMKKSGKSDAIDGGNATNLPEVEAEIEPVSLSV